MTTRMCFMNALPPYSSRQQLSSKTWRFLPMGFP